MLGLSGPHGDCAVDGDPCLAAMRVAAIDLARAQYALGIEPVAMVRGLMDLTHAVTLAKVARHDDPALAAGRPRTHWRLGPEAGLRAAQPPVAIAAQGGMTRCCARTIRSSIWKCCCCA